MPIRPLRSARLPARLLTLLTICGCAPPPTPPPAKPPAAARVRVAPVTVGSLALRHTFLGQVQAQQAVMLAAPVGGLVARVEARVGDAVPAGAALVALDEALIRPQLAAARASADQVEAELAQARREQARVGRLRLPVVSDAEREKFDARVAILRARRAGALALTRQLEAELARHVVRAPFSGVVRTRRVEPGAWVSPGAPLLEVISAADLEVFVEVPATLLEHVVVGVEARVAPALAADGPRAEVARVVGVVPTLDEATRAAKVRLLPAGRPPWLVAGRAVGVTFTVEQPADGVIVPRDALVRGPAAVRVVEAVDGKARSVPVTVVAQSGTYTMVRGDLRAGALVVVRGNERLRPDQPLDPQPDPSPLEGAR
jgi:membrane fusion protein (multidrug efflux system)